MKKVQLTMIMAIATVSLTIMSCNGNSKEDSAQTMHSEMNQDAMGTSQNMMGTKGQNPDAQKVLNDYMTLKDALVATDEGAAAKAGKELENTLKSFNVSSYTNEQQEELKDIIEDATEHAEHIGKSKIDHQREHFKSLSKDVMDMVAITGTEHTLYQQFCPMYADGGGAWLSMEKNIRNPYFGSKMMKCGEVQKEIN